MRSWTSGWLRIWTALWNISSLLKQKFVKVGHFLMGCLHVCWPTSAKQLNFIKNKTLLILKTKYFYWKKQYNFFFLRTNYFLQNRIYFFAISIFLLCLVQKDRISFWNKVVFFENFVFIISKQNSFFFKTKLTFHNSPIHFEGLERVSLSVLRYGVSVCLLT